MEEPADRAEVSELARSLQEVFAAVLRGLAEPRAAELARELAGWLQAESARLSAGLGEPAAAPGDAPVAPVPTVLRRLRLGGREVLVPTPSDGVAPEAPVPAGALPPAPRPTPPVRVEAVAPPSFAWPRPIEQVSARLDLQARACEHALRGERSSPGPEPEVEALLEARRWPDLYLWALDARVALPEREALERCARAYENLARALEVAKLVPAWVACEEEADEDCLQLVAEAQSALSRALEEADLPRDPDQALAFRWLREQTATFRVYLPRHMSLETRADPAGWHDLSLRIEQVAVRLRDAEGSRREAQRLLGKLRYHLERLGRTEEPEHRREEWRSILHVLEAWVASGRPPSSREVCALLIDEVEELPDDLEVPREARRVLLALDEQLAARERSTPEPRAAPSRGPEVTQARALLAGKVVLMIGGHRRAFQAEQLERELGMAELRWISTRAHRSLRPLVEELWRPEVALVVVAPRWSDHAFIELKAEAQKAGKPFLLLPGGYGTNRFAYEVMRQVSGQLVR